MADLIVNLVQVYSPIINRHNRDPFKIIIHIHAYIHCTYTLQLVNYTEIQITLKATSAGRCHLLS